MEDVNNDLIDSINDSYDKYDSLTNDLDNFLSDLFMKETQMLNENNELCISKSSLTAIMEYCCKYENLITDEMLMAALDINNVKNIEELLSKY